MRIPDEIIASVKNAQCILFLGAMASAQSPKGSRYQYTTAPPSGAELSRRLVEKTEYPYEDITNLQRVALYCQYRERGSRKSLVDAIIEQITMPGIVPSPALHMLAAMPFSIIITTNYDKLFDIALSRANARNGQPKQPVLRVYEPELKARPEFVPLDPKEETPVLLKLHGDIDRPESIVVTEEDYLNFIHKMSDQNYHPIHENIRARLNTWPILFIGYSLRDYNLRLLFRTLRWHTDVANLPLSFSVDPSPDDLIVSIWQRGEKPMVSFIQEDLWSFVPEFYETVMGESYNE